MNSTWDDKTLQSTWDLKSKNSGKSIVLTPGDIKSSLGGEGLIYYKGGVIHKVYPNDKFLPPEKKLLELQKLNHPSLVVPKDILVDNYGKLRGFSMPYKDAYELCMLFPKAFKDRHKITLAQITELVKIMQDGNKYLHSHGFLMVDGNEMNYLVDKKFNNVYFIDCNSYQTPSFPASAIMDSVRDPHAKTFTKETDWYSWAIVTFQMFIGIHPFKGIHKKNLNMAERMKQNISVFNPDVNIPAICAPFDTIPSALLDWYRDVFENQLRSAPPDTYTSRVISGNRIIKQTGSDNFAITLMYTYQKDIIDYVNGYTMTTNGLYKNDKAVVGLHDVVHVAQSQQGTDILARLENGRVKLFPVASKVEIPVNFNADDIMSYNGRLYLLNQGHINEVVFVSLGNKDMPTLKKVGNVIENNTAMFEGCAISSMSNLAHISIFPSSGTCYQLQIPELVDYKVLDAKFDNGVLVLVASRHTGEHDKFIFRFDAGFKSYDVRVQKSIQVSEINFVVLQTGIVLHMTDTGVLECFKAVPGAKDIMEIDDQAIDTDCTLLKNGAQAMFARGEKLYKFSMQKNAGSNTNTPKFGSKKARDKNTGQLIDVTKVAQTLIQKDKTFKDIYKDDDVLINAIIGNKKGTPSAGMI